VPEVGVRVVAVSTDVQAEWARSNGAQCSSDTQGVGLYQGRTSQGSGQYPQERLDTTWPQGTDCTAPAPG